MDWKNGHLPQKKLKDGSDSFICIIFRSIFLGEQISEDYLKELKSCSNNQNVPRQVFIFIYVAFITIRFNAPSRELIGRKQGSLKGIETVLKLTTHFISQYIQTDSIPWLEASLDQQTKTTFMARLITVLLRTLLIELSNTFYLTENNKNKNLFWHKFEWKQSTMEHINLYCEGGALKSASNPEQNPSRIRFIPSGDKFRMVMPLSRQILDTKMPNGTPLDQIYSYKGIKLTMGKVIVSLLKHLIDRINNDLVVNAETVKVLHNRIKTFLIQNHQREIHGIQCDIEKCYDSLPIKSVLKLCKREIAQFTGNNSHIQYDFDVELRGGSQKKTPCRWSFKPCNGWENRRLPNVPLQFIISWLDQVPMLPIRHYDDVYNYRFMPHSLLISKVAVCLYLQSKSVKMTTSDEFKSAPFLACRMVDDIIILSADAKLCYTFYKSMADFISLNDRKTQCSLHIDPMLNGKETTDFNIAGVALSPDFKTVWVAPRINKNPIVLSNSRYIPETIQRSLSGLLNFFCVGNIAPISIVTNPRCFKNDIVSYTESIFITLINRFYCIVGHCNDSQRATVKAEFLLNLVRIATEKINRSLRRSIGKSPIDQKLKKILLEWTWKLIAMSRTAAIRKLCQKYKKCSKMALLRIALVSKRPPKPVFDDKWQMEIWKKVSRRFEPVANKKEIVKNLTTEF